MEYIMATKPSTTSAAPAQPDVPTLEAGAPAVTHDRATTPVGAGRIRFKGHNAAAGYPFRVWEGQVQALVNDEWVDAPDAEVIPAT